MTKRIEGPRFAKAVKNLVETPAKAATSLALSLPHGTRFVEPAAGAGKLVQHLRRAGHVCAGAFDIAPRSVGVTAKCGMLLTPDDVAKADVICTNPPFTRKMVVPLITHWLTLERPLYLLMPIDWVCNIWFEPFLTRYGGGDVIGRVRWIEDSPYSGTTDYVWGEFSPTPLDKPPFKARKTGVF